MSETNKINRPEVSDHTPAEGFGGGDTMNVVAYVLSGFLRGTLPKVLFLVAFLLSLWSERGFARNAFDNEDAELQSSFRSLQAAVSAKETATNCAVYRKVALRSNQELSDRAQQLKQILKVANQSREALLQCAKEKNISTARPDAEALLASVCSQAYEAWLKPTYRVHMARQDVQASKKELRSTSALLQTYCAHIPG